MCIYSIPVHFSPKFVLSCISQVVGGRRGTVAHQRVSVGIPHTDALSRHEEEARPIHFRNCHAIRIHYHARRGKTKNLSCPIHFRNCHAIRIHYHARRGNKSRALVSLLGRSVGFSFYARHSYAFCASKQHPSDAISPPTSWGRGYLYTT